MPFLTFYMGYVLCTHSMCYALPYICKSLMSLLTVAICYAISNILHALCLVHTFHVLHLTWVLPFLTFDMDYALHLALIMSTLY